MPTLIYPREKCLYEYPMAKGGILYLSDSDLRNQGIHLHFLQSNRYIRLWSHEFMLQVIISG